MTVEGGLGGAGPGFTAGAGEVLAVVFASAGVVVAVVVAALFESAGFTGGAAEVLAALFVSVVAALFVSAGVLDVAGGAAVASLMPVGGANFFLPNIGDQ